MKKSALALIAAAGLATVASAQIAQETAWKFDGAGASGVTKVGGPAEVYAADDLVFSGATVATWVQALPLEGLTQAQQGFSTASSYGLPPIGGADRVVLYTAGTRDLRGGANSPNDGLAYVLWTATGNGDNYRWTLGADMLIPAELAEGARITFLNDGYGNYNDADGNITVGAGGALIYTYRGSPVDLGVTTGQWFRFIQIANAFTGSSDIYVNGSLVGATGADWCYNRVNATNPVWSNGDAVDPILWAAWGSKPSVFAREANGAPGTLDAGVTLFGDDNGEGERFYIANLYWAEGNFCDSAAANQGGPSAAGFTRGTDTSVCAYPPSITASFTPPNALPTAVSKLTATVTPGTNPAAAITTVTVDLSAFGGSSTAALNDSGANGDVAANDGVWSRNVTVPLSQASQQYTFSVTATDAALRSVSATAGLYVDDNNSGTNASQWDFEAADLAPSFGPGIMSFWDRATPGVTESLTEFGTTTSFGIPGPGGAEAKVMRTARYTGDEGFTVDTNSPGNNGSFYVNAYSLVFDIYVPSAGDRSDYLPFFNTNDNNNNDADAYFDFTNLSAGIGALGYSPASSIQLDTWMRVAFVYDLQRTAANSFHAIYLNGTEIHRRTGFGGFDGRFALYSTTDGDPVDTIHLFTEPDGLYTSEAFVNSVYFVDRRLSAAEIGRLGGPDANGIYPPSCPADFNGDGFVDFFDFDDFVLCFEGGACPPALTADFNEDGFVDFFDFDDFVLAFETGC